MDLKKSIERFNTSNLRKFFELQELYYLHLEDEDYKKLTNHRITGASFLVCSKEDLEKIGLLYGPILELHHLKTIITDAIKEGQSNTIDELKLLITKVNEQCDLEVLYGETHNLIAKILSYHRTKNIRSLREYKESCFQTAVELLLSANLFISETRLIVEYKPKRNSYSYGFIDIFMSDFATGNSVVIELKLFNIVGLFNGARALGTYEIYPHHDKLEVLDKELNLEPEESLFKRNYMYWSKDDKKYISVTVSDHINHGIEQLNRYINTLSSGNANIPNKKIGILDNRIIIEEGRSYLKGILISSFGSQRVLVKETSIMKIDYQYYIKQLV